VFRLALRDARKAGLLTTLGVAFFFTAPRIAPSASRMLTQLTGYWVQRVVRIPPLYAVALEIVVVGVLGFLIVKRLKKTETLTAALNLFALVLVAMPMARIALVKGSSQSMGGWQAEPYPIAASPNQKPPDVYYILLDAYARSDVMRVLFDFDNTPFLDRLESKGFYVARRSTANYCQTPLCLSSSLNSTYLDDMVRGFEGDQTELSGFIGRSRIVETLRPLGYKFVTFATGFEPTDHPEADVYLSRSREPSAFHRLLLDATPLGPLFVAAGGGDPFTKARERIEFTLDHLPDVAGDPAPTFTFAHVLCPHPPFLFGEEGEDVSHRDDPYFLTDGEKTLGTARDPEVYRRGYRAQAVFVTRRIEQVIDRILAESPEPPIIILQSDHGSGWRLRMNNMELTDLRERMSILNAYYFPGGRYEGLYDTITAVNSFRVVLNTFFGGRLDLLPDQSFFSTWGHPYTFMDVTSEVEGRLYDEDAKARGGEARE
jgi:hypothetical protein